MGAAAVSQNFLRKCTLSLSGSSTVSIPGGGPTDLQIQASIGASTIQTPNPASFTITNPNPQTYLPTGSCEATGSEHGRPRCNDGLRVLMMDDSLVA